MTADEGPAIIFGARRLRRTGAQLCFFRKMRTLERCDDTVRFGLVLEVLHARLALLLGFVEVEATRLDVLEDAVLLGVLARRAARGFT
jgi:hypothetical protein